jgi:hypothetical protein
MRTVAYLLRTAYCLISCILTALIGVEKVIVAVKASKEIPKTSLVWSLTRVSDL